MVCVHDPVRIMFDPFSTFTHKIDFLLRAAKRDTCFTRFAWEDRLDDAGKKRNVKGMKKKARTYF